MRPYLEPLSDMLMPLGIFAVMALLTTATIGAAKDPLGWGGYHCSRWTEDHLNEANVKNLSDTGLSQVQWVMGYLQGAAGPELPEVSDNYIVVWINDYCTRQPPDPTIEQAAQALLRDLLHR